MLLANGAKVRLSFTSILGFMRIVPGLGGGSTLRSWITMITVGEGRKASAMYVLCTKKTKAIVCCLFHGDKAADYIKKVNFQQKFLSCIAASHPSQATLPHFKTESQWGVFSSTAGKGKQPIQPS